MKHLLLSLTILLCLFSCKDDEDAVKPSPNKPTATKTYKDSIATNFFRQKSGVVAADVAQSIPIGNNQSLWVFGDSYIDHYDDSTGTVPCLFQVRNAASVSDNVNFTFTSTLLGSGSPASYFEYNNSKDKDYWFWPNAGYQQGNSIYVFLGLIHATGQAGSFGFEVIDSQYVARINASDLTQIEYINLGSKNEIAFNSAVIQDGGYIYVYGIRDNGFGRDLMVARYPKDSLLANWEYRKSGGWTKSIKDAEKIHDAFTSSFHLAKVAGKYILVTTEFSVDCNQGKEIYSYVSNTPYGPFGNKQTIWTVNDILDGNFPFFYQANIHPEFNEKANELLITYCINGYGTCVNTCVNNRFNPDYYRAKAIRVPYSVIGI